jgi:hypothetical protein
MLHLPEFPIFRARLSRGWIASIVLAGSLVGAPVAAAPVKVVHPEGPSRGFVSLSDLAGKVLAHGELTQWLERGEVVSRLAFDFDDGSVYDEIVRFSQKPVFRILSYQLVQKGPSFPEASEVRFERSGKYEARLESKKDGVRRAKGKMDLPEDVSNGMTSTLLKNLPRGASATTHLVSFDPEPIVLEFHLTPEGTDPFWVGKQERKATRFLAKPKVTGLTGVLATVVGKQPEPIRMWIAQGKAPVLVRFEGSFYVEGPDWRVEMAAPTWKR